MCAEWNLYWRASRLLLVGILLGLSCIAPAIAQTLNTYSDATSSAINDVDCGTAGQSTRTFNVPTSYIVQDIDVGIFLTHTYRSDLRITLTSPSGTSVTVMTWTGNVQSGDNVNDRFDDEAASALTAHNGTVIDPLTPAPPPYSHSFQPASPLSAFDRQNAQGNWILVVCDAVATDTGTLSRADLFITGVPTNYVDLSVNKTVSSASPTSGSTVTYSLSVTNDSLAPGTATNVAAKDVLPGGLSYVTSSGFGSYSSSTGIWTVGSIPPGATRTLTIDATVTASSGATVTNSAEVSAEDQVDWDSTPNNGVTTEDDYKAASLTVTGTRTAGTPPMLTCPAGTTLFDWDTTPSPWPAGSTNRTLTVPNLGSVPVAVTSGGVWQNNATFGGQSPALSSGLTGGLSPTQLALTQSIDFATISQTADTVITLPAAVAGLQFRIFDVDFTAGQFADKVTVTGSLGGGGVSPTLTNGISNAVAGGVAIGDAAASDNSASGTVWVTFPTSVDKVTISFGNHTTAPANPTVQTIGIHDITFCHPLPAVTMLKSSMVYDNGIDPPLATPGNDAMYSIQMINTGWGSISNNTVLILDALPAAMTFFNGDANGAAAGTDPVIFTDASSGLTYSYASDVRYATSAPASFAACGYTPAAGYDPNVRYICINPKGTLLGKTGATAPGFTVQFRAKIK
jgi:uncharacterized repeat protein (TIGR01451 family)